MDKWIAIMRGLPGQGKSTIAAKLKMSLGLGDRTCVICSADDYFMIEGQYRWSREKLGAAHNYCMKKFEAAVTHGTTLVIVDNTNIKRRDFKAYKDFGLKYGYKVFEIAVGDPNDVDTSEKRNTHGVPRESLVRMSESWQK